MHSGQPKNQNSISRDAEVLLFAMASGGGGGARGGALGWGTALQAGKSRVRFPMVSLEQWSWARLYLLTEMSTRNISCGAKATDNSVDNFSTFMSRLSGNVVASTSWNPHGLSYALPIASRPVLEHTQFLISGWIGGRAAGVLCYISHILLMLNLHGIIPLQEG